MYHKALENKKYKIKIEYLIQKKLFPHFLYSENISNILYIYSIF